MLGWWHCSPLSGAVETLDLEVRPLGIKTIIVEPGFFRTELLNESNTVYVDTEIDEYKPVVSKLYAQFKGAHHQQPEILPRSEGVPSTKSFPPSLALGPDAVTQLRKKCTDTVDLLDRWEAVSADTTF
ncbi:estradiol 17-beta-dehydrogenase [Colletotrichum tofieldiae]|uniref:Estradiol 17-beta-dehydrogenase n=1 Tax=Colletotrichum tofieldiae TaxID=708197 RepID=A0A166QKB7_9PEZI|nr:estradiol 17-beta-dehydrogenase [Colletotrichum tofieldiae]